MDKGYDDYKLIERKNNRIQCSERRIKFHIPNTDEISKKFEYVKTHLIVERVYVRDVRGFKITKFIEVFRILSLKLI